MHKILIVSDTHGNYRFLRNVLNNENDCDMIIHLGDYYEDLDEQSDITSNKQIIRVPGILNPGYFSGKYPYFQKLEIDGISFVCIHALQDLKRSRAQGDIVLFGHTHKPELVPMDDHYLLNPGHLKRKEDRGFVASYCILEMQENEIVVKFKDYLCNLKQEIPLELLKKGIAEDK